MRNLYESASYTIILGTALVYLSFPYQSPTLFLIGCLALFLGFRFQWRSLQDQLGQ